MTKQIRKASAAQEKFEQARRNWLGPDLTDEEARKLIAATEAMKEGAYYKAWKAQTQRGADR